MNTFTKTITVLSIALGSVAMANANPTPTLFANDDSASTRICMAASKTSKLRLNSTIKSASLTKRQAVEDIKCNDMTLIEFVEKYSENATVLNDYLTSGEYSKSLSASN